MGKGRKKKTYHAHGLAEDEDEGLVGDGDGARQEEEAEGDVEEREGGEDGLGRDERHGWARVVCAVCTQFAGEMVNLERGRLSEA